MNKNKLEGRLIFFVFLALIFIVVIGGAALLGTDNYGYIIVATCLLTVLPLLFVFEKKENSASELMLLAALVALSSVGRIIFVAIPGFKPVAALTIIAAVYLGKEAGFIVGAMSAVVSNLYFGQGPWTPFQMLGWGIIGLLAGLFMKGLSKSRVLLLLFGALAGIVYSAVTDIWPLIMAEGETLISRYLTLFIASLPVAGMYAVSNVIFLLLLGRPIGSLLERLKTKYGLFCTKS